MNTTQSPPDLPKAIRMSRALLDEGYSREHVTKALSDKGFNAGQIAHILKAGQQQVFEDKLKQSRNWLIILGFLWVVSVTVYWMTDHTETYVSLETGQTITANEPGWLAQRWFLTLGGLSAITIIRHLVLFVKSANHEVSK